MPFRVAHSVGMTAFSRELWSAVVMVAVGAHALGVVGPFLVRTPVNAALWNISLLFTLGLTWPKQLKEGMG